MRGRKSRPSTKGVRLPQQSKSMSMRSSISISISIFLNLSLSALESDPLERKRASTQARMRACKQASHARTQGVPLRGAHALRAPHGMAARRTRWVGAGR